MPINCLLIEDEPLAQERLKGYIEKVPFLHLLGVFDNPMEAMPLLQVGQTDLLFLDINLGDFSGIRLLETVPISAQVIITTAYDEYALKGFDLQVTDYLLKPFTFERFFQAVERAKNQTKTTPLLERKSIFIKTEYRLEKVLLSDIIYIEGMRDYRRIYTTQKSIMTLKTFRELEQEIPSAIVCRVHKSFMVAVDRIDAVEGDRIRIGEIMIPLSDTYKKTFLAVIQ